MTNTFEDTQDKKILTLLTNLLPRLGYDPKLITKINDDLNKLISSNLVISLLEELNSDDIQSIKQDAVNQNQDITLKIIESKLSKPYPKEFIESKISKITLQVVTDYLEHIYDGSTTEKKKIIETYTQNYIHN